MVSGGFLLLSVASFCLLTGSFLLLPRAFSFGFPAFSNSVILLPKCFCFAFHCFSFAFQHFPFAFPLLFVCFPTLLLSSAFHLRFSPLLLLPGTVQLQPQAHSQSYVRSRCVGSVFTVAVVFGAHFQSPQVHSQSYLYVVGALGSSSRNHSHSRSRCAE